MTIDGPLQMTRPGQSIVCFAIHGGHIATAIGAFPVPFPLHVTTLPRTEV